MKTAIAAVSVLIALAAFPHPAGADGTPPPLAVASTMVGPVAVVSWTVSTEALVTYNVYGVSAGGALTLLDTTEATSAVVNGGFLSYAVSAVGEAGESQPTYSSARPCVIIQPTQIPPVSIILDCMDLA